MTAPLPRRRLVLTGMAALLLAACAQPPLPAGGAPDHWSGRLAVQVEEHANVPPQSFSAGFELKGTPNAGELTLFNPLGNTLARLEWSPGHALLLNGQERRQSASLQALVLELVGSDLPIAALFGWLKGEAVQAAGWQADLGALDSGRLAATRHTPAPQTTLRIILSQ